MLALCLSCYLVETVASQQASRKPEREGVPLTLSACILSVEVEGLKLMGSRQHQGLLVYVPEPEAQRP